MFFSFTKVIRLVVEVIGNEENSKSLKKNVSVQKQQHVLTATKTPIRL